MRHDGAMPTEVSKSVLHHGKRHRFAVTAKDESDEAFKAALDELDEMVLRFTKEIRPVRRQAYRKSKR
jgi:hypothetical protein